MKTCQFCAEQIQDAAVVCRFCGRDVRASTAGKPTHTAAASGRTIVAFALLAVLFAFGGAAFPLLFIVSAAAFATAVVLAILWVINRRDHAASSAQKRFAAIFVVLVILVVTVLVAIRSSITAGANAYVNESRRREAAIAAVPSIEARKRGEFWGTARLDYRSVFLSSDGRTFHRPNCPLLDRHGDAIPAEKAISRTLAKCPKCTHPLVQCSKCKSADPRYSVYD